jgi:hypothetical protein
MIAARMILAVSLLLCAAGCAEGQRLPPEEKRTVYVAQGFEGSVLERYAPVFLTYGYGEPYNRIGKPTAVLDEDRCEQISVDATRSVIY